MLAINNTEKVDFDPKATTTSYRGPYDSQGYIGLAPYSQLAKESSFLYDMLSKKMIESLVFAFDFRSDQPQMRLGAFNDKDKVLKEGEKLKKIKTIDASHWQVKLKEASIYSDDQIPLKEGAKIEFAPNLPFIYLPEDDFIYVSNQVNKQFRH